MASSVLLVLCSSRHWDLCCHIKISPAKYRTNCYIGFRQNNLSWFKQPNKRMTLRKKGAIPWRLQVWKEYIQHDVNSCDGFSSQVVVHHFLRSHPVSWEACAVSSFGWGSSSCGALWRPLSYQLWKRLLQVKGWGCRWENEGGAVREGRYKIKGERTQPKGGHPVKGFCPSAHRHSKLSPSNREMFSVLAEGKRSLWSVGLL